MSAREWGKETGLARAWDRIRFPTERCQPPRKPRPNPRPSASMKPRSGTIQHHRRRMCNNPRQREYTAGPCHYFRLSKFLWYRHRSCQSSASSCRSSRLRTNRSSSTCSMPEPPLWEPLNQGCLRVRGSQMGWPS